MKTCGPQPRCPLRQKQDIDPRQSDLEIFRSLETGDAWLDADLPGLFLYLYPSPGLKIPDTWQSTMARFKKEMSGWVSLQHAASSECRVVILRVKERLN